MSANTENIELLQSVESINPAWLQAALHGAGIDSPKITRVGFDPIGNGNTNDTYKLKLEYAEPSDAISRGVPTTLILKVHSSNPEVAQMAGAAGVLCCEHEMTKLLPSVHGLLVPKIYYSAVSDDGCQSNILMQDLSEQCEAGDQIKGVDPEQAIAAIAEQLKLHKHFWNSPELDGFDWLVTLPPIHHEGADLIKQRIAHRLSEDELKIMSASLPLIDNWLSEKPDNRTLVHSDCRADNILFGRSSAGKMRAYLIDWAMCACGDPMTDVAYLMSSSLPVKDRAVCEEKAIAIYAEEIGEIDRNYTEQSARVAYRKNITSSIYTTFQAGFTPQNPHTDKLLETLVRRNCATLKDWLY